MGFEQCSSLSSQRSRSLARKILGTAGVSDVDSSSQAAFSKSVSANVASLANLILCLLDSGPFY